MRDTVCLISSLEGGELVVVGNVCEMVNGEGRREERGRRGENKDEIDEQITG